MLANAIISLSILLGVMGGLALLLCGLERIGVWLIRRKYRKIYDDARQQRNRKDVA